MDRTVVHEPLTVAQSVAQNRRFMRIVAGLQKCKRLHQHLQQWVSCRNNISVSIFTVDLKWHVSPRPLGALAFVHYILCCRAIGGCFDFCIFFYRANVVTVTPFATVDVLRANVPVPCQQVKHFAAVPLGHARFTTWCKFTTWCEQNTDQLSCWIVANKFAGCLLHMMVWTVKVCVQPRYFLGRRPGFVVSPCTKYCWTALSWQFVCGTVAEILRWKPLFPFFARFFF